MFAICMTGRYPVNELRHQRASWGHHICKDLIQHRVLNKGRMISWHAVSLSTANLCRRECWEKYTGLRRYIKSWNPTMWRPENHQLPKTKIDLISVKVLPLAPLLPVQRLRSTTCSGTAYSCLSLPDIAFESPKAIEKKLLTGHKISPDSVTQHLSWPSGPDGDVRKGIAIVNWAKEGCNMNLASFCCQILVTMGH